MSSWTITYRLSGPTELRYKGEVIAIGGSDERHALLVSIAQTMNAAEPPARPPRCSVVIDGYRCTSDEHTSKWHSPSLFKVEEEERVDAANAALRIGGAV